MLSCPNSIGTGNFGPTKKIQKINLHKYTEFLPQKLTVIISIIGLIIIVIIEAYSFKKCGESGPRTAHQKHK